MSEKNVDGGGRLGFLDSLGRLFRAKPEARAAEAQTPSTLAKLEKDFEVAIRELDARVAAQRQTTKESSSGPMLGETASAESRAVQQLRRREEAHRTSRQDIEEMHAQLGTGLSAADLDAIAAFLADLEAVSAEGRNSHSMLPRARHSIAERLRSEAGELAVARLVALLQQAKLAWPDPTHYRPKATPEELEQSRQRRLADVRESFLAQGISRTKERLQGIVQGWGGDYPDRGSPLWQESVLVGVAAGIRGQLIKRFVERLQSDRDLLLSRTEQSVAGELAALQRAIEGGVHSIDQANQAVASSLRVLDELVPEIAWEIVRSELPEARGEFSPRGGARQP